MRPLLLPLLLLLLVTAGAWAADGPIEITVDHPSVVLYSVHGQNDYHAVGAAAVTHTTFNVDRNGRYDVRSEGPGDFFHHWQAEAQDVPAGSSINLVAHSVLDTGRAFATVAVGLLALGAVFGLKRRAPQPLQPFSAPPTQVMPAERSASDVAVRSKLFPPDGSLPQHIGDYQVLDHLGQGGMAVVYRVENAQGEVLALKLPLPHVWDDVEFRRRFGRELKIAGSLQHPNLVRIVDVNDGSGAVPYPFLVMEWVQGRPLNDYLSASHRHPLDNIVFVGVQTLAALTHAHQMHVIHRDIKPSNIMITLDGQVRVMDFGVARQTDGTRLTATDEVLGTPLYMAPEQIEGQPVDARTDIYSVGAILYEMAAGEPPFADPSYLRMAARKVHDETPSLQSRNPQLDPRLEQCIMRMVSRRAEQRPWTAEEAMMQLQKISNGAERFMPVV